jgi:hypothetical protein
LDSTSREEAGMLCFTASQLIAHAPLEGNIEMHIKTHLETAHRNCTSKLHIKNASSVIGPTFCCTLKTQRIAADGETHIQTAHPKGGGCVISPSLQVR